MHSFAASLPTEIPSIETELTIDEENGVVEEVGHQDPVDNRCTKQRKDRETDADIFAWPTEIVAADVAKLQVTAGGCRKGRRLDILEEEKHSLKHLFKLYYDLNKSIIFIEP